MDTKIFQKRLCTVVACPHIDAVRRKNFAHIVRMHAVNRKRNDARMVGRIFGTEV